MPKQVCIRQGMVTQFRLDFYRDSYAIRGSISPVLENLWIGKLLLIPANSYYPIQNQALHDPTHPTLFIHRKQEIKNFRHQEQNNYIHVKKNIIKREQKETMFPWIDMRNVCNAVNAFFRLHNSEVMYELNPTSKASSLFFHRLMTTAYCILYAPHTSDMNGKASLSAPQFRMCALRLWIGFCNMHANWFTLNQTASCYWKCYSFAIYVSFQRQQQQ